MKKALYIIPILIFTSCQNNRSDQAETGLTDLENGILQTFEEVESLLSTDDGKFWNKKLYGPLILVDPESRVFYSNENNSTNDFLPLGAIYTDTLPLDMNIANTAIDWDDKRWSMVMLPLPQEKTARNNLIVHELFHLHQPSLGFDNLKELNNAHLDSYEGRLLLRLELQALEKALKSDDENTRLQHIKNALYLRKKRHKSPEIETAENSLELNEGLAEYTGIMHSGRDDAEMISHLVESKNDFYSNPTFVRSFAYQTIPIYGYLLSSSDPTWHREIDGNTSLTQYFYEAFEIDPDQDISIEQNDYGYEQIEKEEAERERQRIEKIARLKTKFTSEPTLELPFQNMKISFDPRNITPLEDLGTVYPNLRVSDVWGVLTVENGALLAANWSKVTVSAPIEISDNVVKGDGWQLELDPEWLVEQTDERFQLVKK